MSFTLPLVATLAAFGESRRWGRARRPRRGAAAADDAAAPPARGADAAAAAAAELALAEEEARAKGKLAGGGDDVVPFDGFEGAPPTVIEHLPARCSRAREIAAYAARRHAAARRGGRRAAHLVAARGPLPFSERRGRGAQGTERRERGFKFQRLRLDRLASAGWFIIPEAGTHNRGAPRSPGTSGHSAFVYCAVLRPPKIPPFIAAAISVPAREG